MRRVLEELYHGNINPNVKLFIRNTQYSKAVQTLSENEDLLCNLLEGKEKKLFLDFRTLKAKSTVSPLWNILSRAFAWEQGWELR